MAWDLFRNLDRDVGRWHLRRCHNVNDLRTAARRRVPAPMFHYMDGAADDEVTLRRNSEHFEHYELRPRFMRDISQIDTSTSIMGQQVSMPLVLAPTGFSRLFHHDGELAVARAAARAGTAYTLSTMGTFSIEDVAGVCDGTKWFQIYVFKDRTLVNEFIDRCRAAAYAGMMLTIDLCIPGNRERDLRTGMTLPPNLTLKSWLNFALHPLWSLNYLTSGPFEVANVVHRIKMGSSGGDDDTTTLISYIANEFDPTITWDDAAWMAEQWGGPFAVKGVLTAEDALRAVEIGATTVIVSNHGGRQLDYSPAPIDIIPEIREAIGDRAEIILDGGVRRGTDVIKGLARGADACMSGRCYLFGLGAAGEAGVDHALNILHTEIKRDMALIGARNVKEITSEHVRHRPAF